MSMSAVLLAVGLGWLCVVVLLLGTNWALQRVESSRAKSYSR